MNIYILVFNIIIINMLKYIYIYMYCTFSCPEKCLNNFNSLKARLARIFLSKIFVTFLIATSWPVSIFFAELFLNKL